MTTKPKPNIITLTRPEAKWFVDAALSSASDDDVTPSICGALVRTEGAFATILCTDRYRVTLAKATVASTADHEFIVPRDALVWLRKNLATFGRYKVELQSVTITTTPDGALAVTVFEGRPAETRGSLTWSGFVTKGNFPPLERLFVPARASDAVSGAHVNLDFIAKARTLAIPGYPPNLKFTTSANPDKPGPLLITFEKGERGARETYAEVLVQPALDRY